jgi:hypothetical protein
MHGVRLRQRHAAFGAAALAGVGHAVPAGTRALARSADAVLLAGPEEPAFEALIADLDLHARLTAVRFGRGAGIVCVTPLEGADPRWAIQQAFALAESRLLRLTAVGDDAWLAMVDEEAFGHEDVTVEQFAPRAALPLAAFEVGRFDVLAVAPPWADALVDLAAASSPARVAAHGLLACDGPSVFFPAPDTGLAAAGQGIANPSSMLVASALMLEHGLGLKGPAETLAGAVSAALVEGPRTPDLERGAVAATAREFTSNVVAGFQLAVRNAEFWTGAA